MHPGHLRVATLPDSYWYATYFYMNSYKPYTLNLSERAHDYLCHAAQASGRSASSWLRRLLERMSEGHGVPTAVSEDRPVPLAPRLLGAPRAPAAPEGEEWVLVEITAGDVGKSAWMHARDALAAPPAAGQ